jgi:hypothetical protein
MSWRIEVLTVHSPTQVPNRGVSVWTAQCRATGVDEDGLIEFARWVADTFDVATAPRWEVADEHDCPDCNCWTHDPALLFSVRVHGWTKVDARRALEGVTAEVAS